METVAVIDFETTGLSPAQGARATEIAAVLVQDGQIVGRFQSLMNSGAWVPPFIEQLTGITNAMLERAAPARAVMHEVMRFTRGCPLVAHNAAFDRGFWLAEALRAECEPDAAHRFACTLLLSRRLYPAAANHRLGTLAAMHRLPPNGRAHRALADAETTAHLLLQLQQDVAERYAEGLAGCRVTHALLCELQRAQRAQLARCVSRHGSTEEANNRRPPALASDTVLRGEVNRDGRVDRIDISLTARRINQAAAGPYDEPDINGDGRISGAEVSASTKLCTGTDCSR